MRKIDEFLDLVDEAPASDDWRVIQLLHSADIELETIASRLSQIIKTTHNSQLPFSGSPARQEREEAKGMVYNSMQTIDNLLQKL